ncbi:hypothetical protein BDW66DRAFT_69005 [Aspergillus desertorum]
MAKHTPSDAASISTLQLCSPKQQRHPSLQLTKRAAGSTRSLPASATTTRINIASDGSTTAPAEELQSDPTLPGNTAATAFKEASKDNSAVETDNSEDPQSNATGEPGDSRNPNAAKTQPTGWLSWVYAPFVNTKATASDSTTEPTPEQTSEPEPLAADQPSNQDNDSVLLEPSPEQDKPFEVAEVTSTSQRRSWLQMWYGSSSSKGPEVPKDEAPSNAQEQHPLAPIASSGPEEDTESTRAEGGTDTPNSTTKSTKASAWSFFFRDSAQEKRPEAQAAKATITQDASTGQSTSAFDSKKPVRNTEIIDKGNVKVKASPNGTNGPMLPDNAVSKSAGGPDALVPAAPEASRQLQKIIPSQVLPAFKDTFALQDRPTLLQSLGRFLHYNKEPSNKHVHKLAYPQRIKKALAIGIHGYFPAPLLRSVLGQPTGTSVRFSTLAAEAISKYTDDQGYTCEIQKIALEGEGRIAERVDLLWKLLLNWMEEIRSADFILVACHSQGVPVGIMLVAKLILFGCINANRVGVCAMAGVNLGPFADYKSRWISGSAGELFEFALPYSIVSKDYESALRTCIDFGVRISYVGSIDDQLVSLESSLFSPVSHPYIYRAAFVDGRVHAPSFVSHLVGFVLKLRNLGISDHGLIRELSSPLAGSLYTGEGHSRLYDEEAVYRLAIEFALETSPVSNVPLQIKRNYPPPVPNPYILPFAMRGLLEEEYVRHELCNETMELLKQFDDWKPTSKVLKDVKFRLEGIRSKL